MTNTPTPKGGGAKTLRDEIAMAALTGMLANGSELVLRTFTQVNKTRGHESIGETYAEAAYEWADAMLRARATPTLGESQ